MPICKTLRFIATYCKLSWEDVYLLIYSSSHVSENLFVLIPRQTMQRVTLQNQLQQLLEAQKSEGKSLLSSPR